MTEPTTKAGRLDAAWDALIERLVSFYDTEETTADIVQYHRAAIEAEARAALDVDDCDSILLALAHFPTWFDKTALKVTALRAVLAEPEGET